jgi:hypothetical protein
LIKKTRETHPDYKDLILALEKIEQIANNVNESVRKYENLRNLNRIVKFFGYPKEVIPQ